VITNAEKAVLFLLSLDESVAATIVGELTEIDLRKLRAVASTMHEVPAGALDDTFRDFLQRSNSAMAVPRGGLPYLRRLSAGALGEQRAKEIFEDGVTSPLARLEGAPPDAVASLLRREPPQLAAAVLARLEPASAAAILAAMDPERQRIVVSHVSRMTELPAKVLEDVACAIANELPTSDASTLVSVDGVAKAAEMLNAAGREASAGILEGMDQEDAALAAQVRQAMFTFDDLRRVEGRAMRDILREVATERVTIALKGAGPEVKKAVFAGLSARAAELIRDDLELLGKVKRTDIEAARREVVAAALKLESEGKVDLSRDGE
jgi:flagellar motor switch protein FliG